MSSWSLSDARRLLCARDLLDDFGARDDAATHLYDRWYAARSATSAPHPWEPPASALLRAAHGLSDRWDERDYPVVRRGLAGSVVIETPSGRRALARGEYVTSAGRPGCAPAVGDRVRPLVRRGALLMDGWWRTWGGGWDPREPPERMRRMYVAPRTAHLAAVVHQITLMLSRCASPWCVKVVGAREALSRPDALVAYVPETVPVHFLESIARAIAPWVGGEGPALTALLAAGVAWAEDPGTGRSFGEERCAAVVSAHRSHRHAEQVGMARDDAWLDCVAAEFTRQGIDPAQPHLRSGAATVTVAS